MIATLATKKKNPYQNPSGCGFCGSKSVCDFVHRLHEIFYGSSLFLPWANTHGKSMGTYVVGLVASTCPVLTLSGCQRREGLLDMRKLAGKKNNIRPKIKAKKDTDTTTILLYDDIFDHTSRGRWWAAPI